MEESMGTIERGLQLRPAMEEPGRNFPAVWPRAVGGDGVAQTLLVIGPGTDVDIDRVDGVRLAGRFPASRAAAQIRAMAIVDIVWLSATETIEPALFADICDAACERRCSLVCETALAALDRLTAAIPDAIEVQWLVEADGTDRLVALAAARRLRRQVVHEVTRDPAMERIDRLQEEVARISRLLGDLAGQRGGLSGTPPSFGALSEDYGDYSGQVRAPARDFAAMPRSFVPEERAAERQRAKAVRRMLRQRRMREQYFPADLFADPAWDMLLDLYARG